MSSKPKVKRSKSIPKKSAKPKFQKDISAPNSNPSTPRATPDVVNEEPPNDDSTARSSGPTPSNLYVINEANSVMSEAQLGIIEDTNEGFNSRLSMESFEDIELLPSLKSSAADSSRFTSTGEKKKVKFSLNGAAW